MRVGPAGLRAESVEHAIELAHHVTCVTHDHPEGLKGGAATAVAIHLARQRHDAETIRAEITTRFA